MNRKINSQNVIFLIIVALFWFAQYVYIPYQTTYLMAIGTASSMVGVVVGAYGISQLILRLPVGLCADRIGRHKPFIMMGAMASGAASVFRVLLCNGYGFMAANLLSGFASAMWISFMVYYTGKFKIDEQQKATSRIVMFNNLGMLLGFIASTLCYSKLGMKKLCILSVLAGGIAFFLAFLLKEERIKKGTFTVQELLGVCKGRQLLMFSVIALVQQGIQLTTTMSFTNQILKDYGASDGIVGISSIIYMVSAVAFSAMASSKLCERKGPAFWVPAVLAVIVIYCTFVPIAGSIPWILILQVLPGMATGILFSYATSEAMREIPEGQKSTAMGFYQAVYAVGMTVFPMFTGSIVSSKGMQAGYLVLAGIALIGGITAKVYYITQKSKTGSGQK